MSISSSDHNAHRKLLSSISIGDPKAFKKLYDLFSDKVYNTAISYLQNQQDAEEITQDVFLKIHSKAHTFKGNSAVSTWIYRITINASLNFIKKRDRHYSSSLDEQTVQKPDFDHPGILLEKKENAKLLFAAIYTLPDSQKTAFILSFVEQLPF